MHACMIVVITALVSFAQSSSRPAVVLDGAKILQEIKERRVGWQPLRATWWSRSASVGESHHWRTTVIGRNILYEDLGDERGVVMAYSTGLESREPHRTLIDENGNWLFCASAMMASSGEGPAPGAGHDPRTFGLRASTGAGSDLENVFRHKLVESAEAGEPVYSARRQGTLLVVEAKVSIKGRDFLRSWTLDSEQGGNVIRAEERLDNRLYSWSQTLYRRVGTEFVPQSVECYSASFQRGVNPRATITVEEWETDRDRLPRKLGPPDVGLDIGTEIQTMGRNEPSRAWDGQRMIPFAEFSEQVRAGQLAYGSRFIADLQKCSVDPNKDYSQEVAKDVDHRIFRRWELFVTSRINADEFSPAQVASARSVLADCKRQAMAFLEKHKQVVLEIGNDRNASIMAPPAGPPRDQWQRDRRARHEFVYGEMERLYKDELVPRIHALRTREQIGAP